MIYNLYCYLDKEAEQYSPPMMFKNDAVFLRYCRNEIKKAPVLQEFSLYQIGTFDDESGNVTRNEPRKLPTPKFRSDNIQTIEAEMEYQHENT